MKNKEENRGDYLKKKKISIYVRNSKITPSSYYRIIQYVKDLDADISIHDIAPEKLYVKNLKISKRKKIRYLIYSVPFYFLMLFRASYFLILDIIRKPDYIIISKLVLPQYMPCIIVKLLDKLTKKSILYWDYDDLIFNGTYSKQVQVLGGNSKKIITTSKYLKDKLQEGWKSKVILMPTTDGDLKIKSLKELDEINEIRKVTFNREIKLVWVASSSSMKYLENILETLEIAAKKLYKQYTKKLILIVVCNEKVSKQFKYLEVINIEWSRNIAIQEMIGAHIGIMPLKYSDFALGKGGFKLVQYMAAGLPCIASAIGYNKEVLSESEGFIFDDSLNQDCWINSIIELSIDWEKWNVYSNNSFIKWNNKFSYIKNLDIWKSMMKL